jgi:integrase
MPRKPLPSYRRQRYKNQTDLAFVEISPGKRIYLGPWGSKESKEEYRRVTSQLDVGETPKPPSTLTIAVLLDLYDDWARKEYVRGDGTLSPGFKHVRDAIETMLASKYVNLPTAEFDIEHLEGIRDGLLKGGRLSRTSINFRIKYIRAIFRWAENKRMVPRGTWEHLKALPGLRFGRSGARDYEPVEPVRPEMIEAVLPLVSRQVRALINLQLLGGHRPGELLELCPADFKDTSKPLWVVKLNEHKTAHHGHQRTLRFGPQQQAILREFMTPERPVHKPLFSPREADEEFRERKRKARKTPLSCGSKSTGKRPRKQLGDAYTVSGYRQAIQRACLRAFPFPPELCPQVEVVEVKAKSGRKYKRRKVGELTKEQKAARKQWRKDHLWHPHQLRHNFITKTVDEFGVGVTQTIVGHRPGSGITARYKAENKDAADALVLKIG